MPEYPSIFNHVIGPVMRGPSSSHTAASWRIGRIAIDLLGEPLQEAQIEFDKQGAWAPNFREQGTVLGMNGGLLGIDMTDDRMKDTETVAIEQEIKIHYSVSSFPTNHPNTVKLTLTGIHETSLELIGVSLGGGAFEIRKINEFDINLSGDSFELLIFTQNERKVRQLVDQIPDSRISIISQAQNILIRVQSGTRVIDPVIDGINDLQEVSLIMRSRPVLTIISGKETQLPFFDITTCLEFAQKEGFSAGMLGIIHEQSLSDMSDSELRSKMKELIDIIHGSIENGLSGTTYQDRILPQQSHLIQQAVSSGIIPQSQTINQIIANVTAIMEAKSALEVVVANPTAGSCGTVGGLIKAVADELDASDEMIIMAYFATGLVGAFFAMGPGFSAEEHGCQVECGAASGMAAAGIVQLYGGTAKQALDAASMAIQNMIGLVCDPVADRVEVPCLGKNISAAVNAFTSATMACAGFDAVIPLNEVLETVSRVSNQMPSCVKCTGMGGLAITQSAKRLKEILSENRENH